MGWAAKLIVGTAPFAWKPQAHDLPRGPDRHGARERPEHVVPHLTAEEEEIAVLGQPSSVVLELQTLRPLHIEAEMPGAVDRERQRIVAGEDRADPPKGDGFHRREARGGPGPGGQRDRKIERVPRPEIAWKPEQEFRKSRRAPRTDEHRRRADFSRMEFRRPLPLGFAGLRRSKRDVGHALPCCLSILTICRRTAGAQTEA